MHERSIDGTQIGVTPLEVPLSISQDTVDYKLKVPTSAGSLTIPQLGGSLTLSGRDSKIHVVDYDAVGTKILYSTAEIFTWKVFGGEKVLVLYGGPGEHHEFAVSTSGGASVAEGSSSGVSSKQMGNTVVVGWDVSCFVYSPYCQDWGPEGPPTG